MKLECGEIGSVFVFRVLQSKRQMLGKKKRLVKRVFHARPVVI